MNNQMPLGQVTPQFWQGVMTVMMVVWFGAWVFSQVRRAYKGEEVAQPPALGSYRTGGK